jgi:lysophospholipase L1-like esterase
VGSGVNFFDATMVFSQVEETVYCDDCCHFNPRGNQIVADYIMQAIKRHSKIE